MSEVAKREPVEAECVVSELNADGLGTALVNDRPLHIRNALPGETVRARILKRRKGIRYADGITVLADQHARRAAPACAYFPRCGGCSLQHLIYAEQLQHKEGQIRSELERVRVSPEGWRAPMTSGELGYRRKARLGVRVVGDQILVGFRESFSNRVARMDVCLTLTEELSALIQPLKQVIARCSEPKSIPQVELAQDDTHVVAIVRHLVPFTSHDLTLWEALAQETGVEVLLQPDGYDSVRALDGGPPPLLSYRAGGLDIRFDPRQFTQVNARMNDVLIARVADYLGIGLNGHANATDPAELKILDLFCGIGNFSLPLAKAGAYVTGVEFAQEAVQQAFSNARHNNITNAEFACMDLYKDANFLSGQEDATALVLDPPRSGAGPLLAHWLQALRDLKTIVYVSCKPKTFADDVKVMSEYGFRLQEVGAYDMFPQTAHVETIGLLLRG